MDSELMTPAPRTRDKRAVWTAGAGAVGLVAGLALGATSLASASSPSPTPERAAPTDARPLGERQGLRVGHGPGGLVSAVDSDSLTLRTPLGTRTVALTSSTTFYEGKDKATAAAVQVGEVVQVRLVDPRATKPVAAVVRVVPAHVAGWVTKVAGSTITVIDHEGFTRRITTGSGTEFTRSGSTSSLSAVTVGDLVRAVGSVAGDGVTLEADRVVSGAPERRLGERFGRSREHRMGGAPGDQPAT